MPGLTAFILDNSVTMRWCFENTSTLYAEEVLDQLLIGLQATFRCCGSMR
jgi:hypothetical protein